MEEAEEQQLKGALSVIAVPLAEKKLIKKLHKLVKKAAASKILKRGELLGPSVDGVAIASL
jgi:hypothetical protein